MNTQSDMISSQEEVHRVSLAYGNVTSSFNEEFYASEDASVASSESDEDALDEIQIGETKYRRGEPRIEQKDDDSAGTESEDEVYGEHGSDVDAKDSNVSLEAFNMKRELADGEFDAEGNYRSLCESDEDFKQEDSWLKDYSSKEVIEQAKKSKRRIDDSTKRNKRTRPLFMLEEALERIYYFIPNGRSVQETLSMYHNLRSKVKTNCNIEERYIQNSISCILILCDVLEQKGIRNVLGLKKDDIESLYKEESISGNQIDHTNVKRWEFKWIEKPDVMHKTFSNYEMQYWKENYFEDRVSAKLFEDANLDSNWYHIECLHFM